MRSRDTGGGLTPRKWTSVIYVVWVVLLIVSYGAGSFTFGVLMDTESLGSPDDPNSVQVVDNWSGFDTNTVSDSTSFATTASTNTTDTNTTASTTNTTTTDTNTADTNTTDTNTTDTNTTDTNTTDSTTNTDTTETTTTDTDTNTTTTTTGG